MTTKCLGPNSIPVPVELAAEIGLNEAIVLQQIHYWLTKESGRIINGVRWIYNSYKKWQEQIKFLSESAIRKAIARLEGLQLIRSERHDEKRWNQTKFYTINYDRLKALQLSICPIEVDRDSELEKVEVNDCSSSSTETTSENTSEIQAEEILENYEDKLKTYGIYVHSWDGKAIARNPKMQPILRVLAKIPRPRAERAIEVFLKWIRTAKNVENKYIALETALWRKWE